MTAALTFPQDSLLRLLPEECTVAADGVLMIAGCRVDDIARTHGTPSYVIDELGLRRQMRRYVDGLHERWPNSDVLFASKSLPCVALYAIAADEGMYIDVAGGGELLMALTAGVDPSRILVHGNAKSKAEISMALNARVGAIVVDNEDDLTLIEQMAESHQDLLVRVIPDVAPATHSSQVTGAHDSKFGIPLAQLPAIQGRISAHPLLTLTGIHLHIGSQVLQTAPFAAAVKAAAGTGTFSTYDIGGGLGVEYTLADHAPSVEDYLDTITEAARRLLPAEARLLIEPGRSVVARAGVLLYAVNTVKHTGRTFVAVDGGMADNMNIALTEQQCAVLMPEKMNRTPDTRCDVVGRQCESGDLMARDALLPDPQVGDLVIVPAAGAYTYTFANNYNGALRPPIIFCADGRSRVGVRRETYDDLLSFHKPALNGAWSRQSQQHSSSEEYA